jgi:hypothetical protein
VDGVAEEEEGLRVLFREGGVERDGRAAGG